MVGKMNASQLIEFLKRLIKDAKRKVILMLDNLWVHYAKLVKVWLTQHKEEIEVFYLPTYSPGLNPDLKTGMHSKPPASNKKQLKTKVLSHMRILQKQPARVMRYFCHPKICYAA